MSDGSQKSSEEQGISIDQSLIDHAERWWRAETENARRLTFRSNLVLTGIIGILGLGLIRLDLRNPTIDDSIGPEWMIWSIKVALVIALALFSRSTWILLSVNPRTRRRKRGRRSPSRLLRRSKWEFASGALQLGRSELEDSLSAAERAMEHAFVRTYLAASELGARNVGLKDRVDRAQQWFVLGVFLLFLAAILLLLFAGDAENTETDVADTSRIVDSIGDE